jgi:hypothetical protein
MILFLDDWKKYPTADVDMTTKNESFIRLSSVYKKMGIKNHAFPLALVNQNLKGIDPFAPDLTPQEVLMITMECFQNPWYYFREIARAPAKGGSEAVKVEGNRANLALWWSFFNHVMFMLIQPRQTGKSFSTDTLMVYLMMIRCRDTAINLLTKDDKLRRENTDRIKDIMSELPSYLYLKTRDDVNNGEQITIKALGNKYNTHVPQPSEKMAHNKGRGLTTEIVHIDEPPFQRHIEIAVKAMLAAMGAATERAAAAGAPYGVIMTTTAGMKDDPDGKWVYETLVQGAASWSERFLDCRNAEELQWMVRKNSPSGKFQINGTFDHRMLGKTDEWLAEKIENALQEGEAAERDYLNIWTSGNERSPFSPEVTERISKNKFDPQYHQIFPEGYILRWQLPENEIEEYMKHNKAILGVDASDAAGRDEICLVLTDVVTGEVMATGAYNETNLFTFSTWLAHFMIKYKNVIMIPERHSSAISMIDHLCVLLPQYGEDPFKRIFNWITQDQGESTSSLEKYREIKQPLSRRDSQFHAERKTSLGWRTSGGSGRQSRANLYGQVLQITARRAGHKIKDPQLISQLLGLVNKGGRIDHEDGSHDDMVIAWLLTHWFLTQGKHLVHYGIEPGTALAGLNIKKEETPMEMRLRFEQQEIRERITQLYEQLTNEEDENVADRIEAQLRSLDRRIVVEEGDVYSFDELLRDAKNARRTRARSNDFRNGGQYQPIYQEHHYQRAGSYAVPPPTHAGYGGFQTMYG